MLKTVKTHIAPNKTIAIISLLRNRQHSEIISINNEFLRFVTA
jgi:hypothetical protein